MSTSISTSASTTIQNTCEVSNNLVLPTGPNTPAQANWNGDVIVISCGNSSSSTTAADGQQLDLTALHFIQEGSSTNRLTATNSNVLPVSTVGTLALPSYTVPGTSTPVDVYGLMACQANNFFPLHLYWRSLQQGVVPAITLPGPSPCNSSSAANAYVFLQKLMAYPTSPLAQQFTASLNAASSPTSSDKVSTTIDAFFSSSADYQNINFETFSAVMNYVQAFPYAWANFASSFTYNIYAEQLKCLGTVVLTLQNNAPTTATDALAAYTITWSPTGQTPVCLSYSGGQFVAPESADFSGLCLQTVFMDMAALSGDPSDSGTPIQALIGLINGINVIAIPASLAPTTHSLAAKTTSLDAITADSSSADSSLPLHIFELILAIAGCTAVIAASIYVATISDLQKDLEEEGPGAPSMLDYLLGPKAMKELKKAQQRADGKTKDSNEVKKDFLSKANQKLKNAGIDQEVKTGQDLSDFQAEAKATIWNAQAQTAEFGQIEIQNELENEQLETRNNPTIQNEISATQSAKSELEKINPENADSSSELASIQASLTANQVTIESEDQSLNLLNQRAVQKQQSVDASLEKVEESDQEKEQGSDDGNFANEETEF